MWLDLWFYNTYNMLTCNDCLGKSMINKLF